MRSFIQALTKKHSKIVDKDDKKKIFTDKAKKIDIKTPISNDNVARTSIFPFFDLPVELRVAILGFLDYVDICRISPASKEFNDLCSSNILWKQLCDAHMGKVELHQFKTWKALFKEMANLSLDPRKTLLSELLLSENNLVLNSTNDHSGYAFSFATKPFTHGLHYWEVFMESIGGGRGTFHDDNVFVSVVADPYLKDTGFKQQDLRRTPHAWSYHITGKKSNGGGYNSSIEYGDKSNNGDLIGVLLDLTGKHSSKRTVSFSLNGRFLGVAFDNLPEKCSFYAAVGLTYKSGCLKLKFHCDQARRRAMIDSYNEAMDIMITHGDDYININNNNNDKVCKKKAKGSNNSVHKMKKEKSNNNSNSNQEKKMKKEKLKSNNNKKSTANSNNNSSNNNKHNNNNKSDEDIDSSDDEYIAKMLQKQEDDAEEDDDSTSSNSYSS